MNGYSHTIVVGGTGMLRAASVELAKRSGALTSVARTERSLARLDQEIEDLDCRHRPVRLDYNDLTELRREVADAIETEGPADLLLAWIHDEQGPVLPALVEQVSRHRALPACQVVHVRGSASADPAGAEDASAGRYSNLESVAYQQVVLGFHLDPETNASRWLTNDEISAGVLEAIDGGSSRVVVGQTRPWGLRP
jgi:NAD(P)-dependent dehydrogenase (short-subunit alcohol dehydrogenase family)